MDTERLVRGLVDELEAKLLEVFDSRLEKISKDIEAKFAVFESRLKYIEGSVKTHQSSLNANPSAQVMPTPPAAAATGGSTTSLADRLAKSRASLLPSAGISSSGGAPRGAVQGDSESSTPE